MKFILICFMTHFSVSEPSLTDGLTYGFVVSNIKRKIVHEPVKHIDNYNFIRDTSLQKFPPIYAPQCITEKRHIIDLSIVEILMGVIIISTVYCVIMCAPDDENVPGLFMGYILGRMVEDILNG